MFRNKDKRTFVEFLSVDDLRYILAPLSDTSKNAIDKFIDRYIDAKMKDHIRNMINGSSIDENLEVKLRGVLEFKEFLKSTGQNL